MRQPTSDELFRLMHNYDREYAHDYYEKHKKLKGRKKGMSEAERYRLAQRRAAQAALRETRGLPPKVTKPKPSPERTAQKARLSAQITTLSDKLGKLEAKIKELEAKAKTSARKSSETKERDKPKTAADKAKEARDSKKYRDKHKTELKNKAKKDAKDNSKGGSSKSGSTSKSSTSDTKDRIDSLKVLATKIRGQIAVAKQKLAAL